MKTPEAGTPAKRKRRLLLLGGVALALAAAVVFLMLDNQRVPTEKPIFAADSTAISAIEITDRDGSIRFEKAGALWNITSPVSWGAEQGRMRYIFERVILKKYSLTYLDKGAQALKQYKLEGPETLKIKVFGDKGRLLSEAWFADTGSGWDYFRFAKDDRVYQIESRVASEFKPRFETWRSPYALRLLSEQMLSIKVRHTRNSYELTRRENVWHYKDKIEDFDIPAGNETMGKILNALAQLGSGSILDDETKPPADSLGASVCDVDILKTDNSSLRISFQPFGENYLMTLSDFPGKYFIVLFDTMFRFSRHASLFRAKVGELPPRGI